MSWIYETLGALFTLFSSVLTNLGVPNVYFFDAVLMFVIIPLVHLMNDEDTKTIIVEKIGIVAYGTCFRISSYDSDVYNSVCWCIFPYPRHMYFAAILYSLVLSVYMRKVYPFHIADSD